MKTPRTNKGFTLIELLVVIGIIALLASIALPAFTAVQVKAHQTTAMNNAKQIGFACKSFSTDNNGQYPTFLVTGGSASSTTQVTFSNDAFNQLVPAYLATLKPFYQPGSPETPGAQVPNDPDMSKAGTGPNQTPPLTAGSHLNHWAYVTGMSDTSNASFPLIADGFKSITATAALYSTSPTEPGGVWKGLRAVVVRVDDSAAVESLTSQEDFNGPAGIDLFNTAGTTAGWMAPVSGGAGNNVVNPD